MVTGVVEPAALEELERESFARVRRVEQLSRAQALTHKTFWIRLLDQDMDAGAFDCDGPFVRFALQPGLISVLAAYLGELPRLIDVLLTYSTPSERELAYSQLWHRDFDDVRTLKVFAYLTDVQSVEDGPFTFLPAAQSDKVGFTLRSHLSDTEFSMRAGREAITQMRAPRLSVFICETSRCFHMGSRVHRGHTRLMYTATFISSPSLYPAGKPRFSARRPLRDDERLVLGL